MPPRKCLFNERWLYKPEFSQWLSRGCDPHSAKCKLCLKEFDVSNMGETALRSHLKGKKHQSLMEAKSNLCTVRDLFSRKSADSGAQEATPCARTQAATVNNFVSRNEVLEAEVLWALKVVDCHYSYKSSENSSQIFQRMFPDSQIAAKFSCAETKCRYLSCYGIAPYFKNLLLDKVKRENGYVLLFDESLNQSTQSKQFDLHVRCWDGNEVKTRYFQSKFIGHSTASDLVGHFHESFTQLNVAHLLQISMDGPNVNWSFYNQLDGQLKKDFNSSLLNIGSCGLHTLHNAFKAGIKASGWGIDNLLSSLHYLFKDCPARREDNINFVSQNGSETVLPLKFCKHRWLENLPVVERAQKIWPNICSYVKAVEQKKLKDPKTKSFDIVKECTRDKLIKAKLACFKSVAALLQPFLILYQTDKPMVPFLCKDLEKIIRDLMDRFIKPEVLKAASTSALVKIDVTEKKNHCDSNKIKLGFQAESIVKELKSKKAVSELEILEITMECKELLLNTVKKLLEKSPLKYSLARNLVCLDPRNIAKGKDFCDQSFKQVLRLLVGANRLEESKCDNVLRQFNNFIDEIVNSRISLFSEFNPDSMRVDALFYENMQTNSDYKEVWSVIRLLLLLSHGQASVERGFSINKQIEVENLKEESYISLRAIKDHIDHVGGILNVKVNKPLLVSAAGARQRYSMYLDEEKHKKQQQEAGVKRKSVSDEISQLKKKQKCILSDIKELRKSADEFSLKAEKTRNFSYVSKANSLRRTANDKEIALTDIDSKIDEKFQELKNS